ncbi:tRNA uridine-5-carboxymethylaminomethyl(34) synthesis GTPase MnmE [Mesorhizobium sp. BR1-1-16]|uniref:tRNA uridine-5-carboxymethylaminomethyl(34) synthesis GTPase MnmE n=1 Tax=Mesorhizobium sp. BR1-1-16 TaxID=2876653 RepID=UPI001CCF2DE8|nr:tRNA uridine-5-carboxymethylaminomethyl(34) synthesis GTPase MnmE [Mesorhizobium sp. BR1-1-16]MBZ9938016.1 tRNA uridine-5-carboxymethylaminomethyl(34) synthesis GTPase MnmE [Mesorhizobium sp. BR1-1-16]
MAAETIFALSSGAPPAGVAVIRLSGPAVRFGLETLLGDVPEPRRAIVRALRSSDGTAIDRGVVLFFAAPASFTGEDVAELQIHGGRAVIAAVLSTLGALPDFRPADAGEFTRRAFENGKADLTEVEGLADLIAAETEMQRRQALALAEGGLSERLESWRMRLLRARALIEAELDFSDEDDVPASVLATALAEAGVLATEMDRLLDDGHWGERVRAGFEVVLLGAPNVGKSSLLNALARREAAIVTAEPGTTRDMIEVQLVLDGHAVTLIDTAGLRETESIVEREGISRARRRGAAADLVLLLDDGEGSLPEPPTGAPILVVHTKSDLGGCPASGLGVSARTGDGLDELRKSVGEALGLAEPRPSALLTRQRQRHGVMAARDGLLGISSAMAPELVAEQLRQAAEGLARVTGRTDVEEMLGVIFGEFCIGK